MAIFLFAITILSACGWSTRPESDTHQITAISTDIEGRRAYESVCAKCHSTGENGAPRTYHKKDWLNRSWLWEAVLFEHAIGGFLDMPARGGEESFDDATVKRAAEYMLSITFPKTLPSN